MSATQSKATPFTLPLKIAGWIGEHDETGASIVDANGKRVCSTVEVQGHTPEAWWAYQAIPEMIVRAVNSHGKLLEALKAAQLELLQTKPSEYSHDVLNLIEAAIQSAEGPGSKAALAVRARWERLGLDPSTAPTVFASDVENMVGEELRGLRDNAGRAVVQYDDPAL